MQRYASTTDFAVLTIPQSKNGYSNRLRSPQRQQFPFRLNPEPTMQKTYIAGGRRPKLLLIEPFHPTNPAPRGYVGRISCLHPGAFPPERKGRRKRNDGGILRGVVRRASFFPASERIITTSLRSFSEKSIAKRQRLHSMIRKIEDEGKGKGTGRLSRGMVSTQKKIKRGSSQAKGQHLSNSSARAAAKSTSEKK